VAERGWLSGVEQDRRRDEREESEREISGVGSGATDLGGTDGDRDAGVLARIKEFEEDSDGSCLIKVKDQILDIPVFESLSQIRAKCVGLDV
jgi:hypothetical protein